MQDIFTQPLWWHWVVFGLVLVVSEIVVPSFVIIWFGLAGIVVGCLDWLFGLSFKEEIALWTVLSVVFLVLWFKVFKPKDLTKKGQADEDIKKGEKVVAVKVIGNMIKVKKG